MSQSETALSSSAGLADAGAGGPRHPQQHTSLQSVGLVILSTLVGAAAQILLRTGAGRIEGAGLAELLANGPLIAGYGCLGINTILITLAFRGGQLSVLYPIISLTYVWVALLAPMYFDDVVTSAKVMGLVLIIVGVSFIGAGSRR